MLKADRDDVVFNLEELASPHTIDGEEYLLVQTSVLMQEESNGAGRLRNGTNPKENAISSNVYTLYIKREEAKRKFTSGAMINYDGRKMFVNDVKHDEGIVKLLIGIRKTL